MSAGEHFKKTVACFISPHGFGHAARAAAILEALYCKDPSLKFEIFTKVPRWFFEDSLSCQFGYAPLLNDIGLAQKGPLNADLLETLERLDKFFPIDNSLIKGLAVRIKDKGCRIIICDISPMGILVAKEAGIPSVLIENFTWDWIYEGYAEAIKGLIKHIQYLRKIFNSADYHIQTEPVCFKVKSSLITNPVSRKPRISPHKTRKELGLPHGAKAVLITMGGIPEKYSFLQNLSKWKDFHFIIPGTGNQHEVRDNLILLPHHSGFFHPDLVHASDVVIGKVGYSTLAEVYYTGVPFGYISRQGFRESPVLVSFIESEMRGLSIKENDFYKGDWLSRLPELLSLSKVIRDDVHGSEKAAQYILGVL